MTADHSTERRQSPAPGPLWAAATLAVIFCLCCGGAGLAAQAGAAGGRLGGGYVVEVCMGVNTLPHFQVGVTWISPLMSSLPPVMLQHSSCMLVPWAPFLSQRGGVALP